MKNTLLSVTTLNVDGKAVTCTWDTLDELKNEWFSDDFSGPSLDDEVVQAVVNGETIQCNTFDDVMKHLGDKFNFKY